MPGRAESELLPWLEATNARLAGQLRVEERLQDDTVTLACECPRCDHLFSTPKPEPQTIVGLDAGTAVDEPVGYWKTVVCACDQQHPGRPNHRTGCGFYADQYFEVS